MKKDKTTKVYPNAATATVAVPASSMELTVWKKSLLPNCQGFTVFASNGNLAYRVDNYSSNKREIILMDAVGSPLLTIRRKRLSLWNTWMVFDDETGGRAPRLVVRKNGLSSSGGCVVKSTGEAPLYTVEGSYRRRCCTVYGGEDRKRGVVEMRPKEAPARGAGFGGDVFRLVINPGIDAPAAMAIVILLDQMFSVQHQLQLIETIHTYMSCTLQNFACFPRHFAPLLQLQFPTCSSLRNSLRQVCGIYSLGKGLIVAVV